MEEWRPVVGFEGFYEVSDQGNVRSLDRVSFYAHGKGTKKFKGRVLKPRRHNNGYRTIALSGGSARSIVQRLIHHLVLEAFVGPAPEGQEACHNNGDRTDNRLENLRWDTRSRNSSDKEKHGTLVRGEAVHNSVFTEEQVRAIRLKHRIWGRNRGNASALAREYGVCRQAIDDIVKGRIWKQVDPPVSPAYADFYDINASEGRSWRYCFGESSPTKHT